MINGPCRTNQVDWIIWTCNHMDPSYMGLGWWTLSQIPLHECANQSKKVSCTIYNAYCLWSFETKHWQIAMTPFLKITHLGICICPVSYCGEWLAPATKKSRGLINMIFPYNPICKLRYMLFPLIHSFTCSLVQHCPILILWASEDGPKPVSICWAP